MKVKVGIGDDAGRVAAVRAAVGPEMAMRLDANGAWDVDEAVARDRARSRPPGLELVEEPVHGVDGAARGARPRRRCAIAMDETAAEPGALASGAADAVCLKIARCGGISRPARQAALVRASGADVYLASTFDGPLGIAAARARAAALRPTAACGSGTLELFADELDGPAGRARRDRGARRARARRLSVSSRRRRWRRHRLRRLARQRRGRRPATTTQPRAGQRRGQPLAERA